MFNWLFGEKSKTQIGIDLGSSSVKIAELGRKDERFFLLNYGLLQVKSESVFNITDLKEDELANVLKTLIAESKITGRRANVSLPVEKTFSTVITMPVMPENELAAAVSFEAQKYVPVPLSEVVLDWTVISGTPGPAVNKTAGAADSVQVGAADQSIQILLLAVPKDIINKITNVVRLAGLNVDALEQEAFSLVRSLIGNDKNTFMIIDLGRRGTDIIVVDQGFIKLSHNLESVNKEIVLMEIDRIVNIFQMRYNKKVGQCFLTGGRAAGKDILEFLTLKLKIPVKVGDPFARIGHGAASDSALKDIAPQFAVAVGLALRDN